MKYTLVLGIEYKKYKKPAEITVSVGEKLIDVFSLDKDYPSTDKMLDNVDDTWYGRMGRAHWLQRADWKGLWMDKPKHYKVYEIDEQDLQGKLQIKVDNSNTDYTNGFMKNNSLIKFQIIALIPSTYLENCGEKFLKVATKFDDAYDKYVKRIGLTVSKKEFIKQEEIVIREKRNYTRWPCVIAYQVQRENETHEKSGTNDYWNWIGGSFTIEIPIHTKHKIRYLGCANGTPYGFFDICNTQNFTVATCKLLLNIYNENK